MLVAFYWAFGNVLIYTALLGSYNDLQLLLASIGNYLYAGAALFLPYGVNQVRAAFGGK